MTRLVDVWRAVDPEARFAAGSPKDLLGVVRGVSRTRAPSPHLPPPATGHLLVVDSALLADLPPSRLLDEIAASGSEPAGLLVAMLTPASGAEWEGSNYPILASGLAAPSLAAAAAGYLSDEAGHLARLMTELRLVAAEAALADPTPSAPVGVMAARMRRGLAVVADGQLLAIHPRPAGRALAARFAAAFSRLLGAPGSRAPVKRRLPDGLWVHEHRIRPGAAVWMFDDLPLARVDEAATEALGITLRALLRRRPAERPLRPQTRFIVPRPRTAPPRATDERLTSTLLAVARANGRVAPAARALGVHRNTVLYRLRIARAERGIDPRRPEDALRLLREEDRPA